MGLTLAATLYEPAFAAVVGWFPTRNRDRALLTVTLVAALASTIFMPLEAWLLTRLGGRTALATLALNGARALAPVGAALLQVAAGGYERVFWMLAVSLVLAGMGVLLLTRHTSR